MLWRYVDWDATPVTYEYRMTKWNMALGGVDYSEYTVIIAASTRQYGLFPNSSGYPIEPQGCLQLISWNGTLADGYLWTEAGGAEAFSNLGTVVASSKPAFVSTATVRDYKFLPGADWVALCDVTFSSGQHGIGIVDSASGNMVLATTVRTVGGVSKRILLQRYPNWTGYTNDLDLPWMYSGGRYWRSPVIDSGSNLANFAGIHHGSFDFSTPSNGDCYYYSGGGWTNYYTGNYLDVIEVANYKGYDKPAYGAYPNDDFAAIIADGGSNWVDREFGGTITNSDTWLSYAGGYLTNMHFDGIDTYARDKSGGADKDKLMKNGEWTRWYAGRSITYVHEIRV